MQEWPPSVFPRKVPDRKGLILPPPRVCLLCSLGSVTQFLEQASLYSHPFGHVRAVHLLGNCNNSLFLWSCELGRCRPAGHFLSLRLLRFFLLSVLSTSRWCQVRVCHCLRTLPRRGTSTFSLTSNSPPASHLRRSRCCARHC